MYCAGKKFPRPKSPWENTIVKFSRIPVESADKQSLEMLEPGRNLAFYLLDLDRYNDRNVLS